MKKLIRPLIWLTLAISAATVSVGADDPDPNSPAPVLVSVTGKTRSVSRIGKTVARTEVFRADDSAILQASIANVELMPDESANAFRVYLYQKSGRTFELIPEQLAETGKRSYSLSFRLADRFGYYGQPAADGESIIYVTWRGMTSNPVRINLGQTGGPIDVPEFLKPGSAVNSPAPEYVGYRFSGDRIRFLEQATFGPSTISDQRLRRIGLRTWLAEQFDAPYPTFAYPEIPLMPTAPPSSCTQITNPTCFRERYTATPLQQWFFKESFYGDAQLRHKTAWALSQIWVTSAVTIQQSSHMIAYHKILSDHAFGNYRDLMEAMTLNPAMGDYLDMIRSTKNNPNENYAREILQLFSIGLFRMNRDGTLMRDGSNNPIPTYDQQTVNDFAKVFTGWTHCNAAGCPNAVPGTLNFKDPMLLNPANHDTGAKTLLNYPNAIGRDVAACANCVDAPSTAAYADASLNQALDNIFNHPNVPPFVSRLLIQQFVTSDPSPAYVDRVAAVFENNGSNVRGDLKAVVRAILLDPEARGDLKTAPRYGKLREPVSFVTNLGRTFPALAWDGQSITDGGLNTQMTKLGQSPFYSPTVFNYFPPDYIVPGTTLNAPEFALLNSSLAINRTNFLYVLVFDGYAPNATDSLRGISLDLSEAVTAASNDPSGNQLLDHINYRMFHNALSPTQRSAILAAVVAVPESNPTLRAKQAVYLAAASSQFQVQR